MKKTYQVIVIGASTGGLTTLSSLFQALSKKINVPIIVVQHLHPTQNQDYIDIVGRESSLPVLEAQDKEAFQPGQIYFAPPGYHLQIESDGIFSLSVDQKVNHCRPSVDTLFESAVDVYGEQIIGVILTGANNDGAKGLQQIKSAGGLSIVQEVSTAECPFMPRAAMQLTDVDCVLSIKDIADKLNHLC